MFPVCKETTLRKKHPLCTVSPGRGVTSHVCFLLDDFLLLLNPPAQCWHRLEGAKIPCKSAHMSIGHHAPIKETLLYMKGIALRGVTTRAVMSRARRSRSVIKGLANHSCTRQANAGGGKCQNPECCSCHLKSPISCGPGWSRGRALTTEVDIQGKGAGGEVMTYPLQTQRRCALYQCGEQWGWRLLRNTFFPSHLSRGTWPSQGYRCRWDLEVDVKVGGCLETDADGDGGGEGGGGVDTVIDIATP